MTFEEYKRRAAEEDGWAPGWEAIDEVFERLYPGRKPAHYATTNRAMLGGDQSLDG